MKSGNVAIWQVQAYASAAVGHTVAQLTADDTFLYTHRLLRAPIAIAVQEAIMEPVLRASITKDATWSK